MTPRYARLAANWLLRGWQDMPWALVDAHTGRVRELTQEGFYVAAACNGQVNFASMAFLPRHLDLLEAYVHAGVAEASPVPVPLAAAQAYRKAPNTRLLGVQWAVTGRCNLRCRHCYLAAPSSRYGEMGFDDVVRLVSQFEAANVASVALTGGEPFLRLDIIDLIRLLAERQIAVRDIYSNGTVIADRHLEAIGRLPYRPVFRISFDGVGTHDLMRGVPGAEARVVDAIRRIRAAGFPVTVTTCVGAFNADALPATYELVRSLDVHAWGIGRPQPAGEWKKTATERLSTTRLAHLCTVLLHRWALDGRPFTIGLEGFYSGKGRINGAWVPEEPPTGRNAAGTASDYACHACREWTYVTPDGTLLPCLGYEDAAIDGELPNLLRMDLSEAWDHPSLRRFVDLTRGAVVARNVECQCCEYADRCGGGCRACGLAASGDVLARDPILCEVWRGGYRQRFHHVAVQALKLRSATDGEAGSCR